MEVYTLFNMRSVPGDDQFSFATVRHCDPPSIIRRHATEQNHAHAHDLATRYRSHIEQCTEDKWREKKSSALTTIAYTKSKPILLIVEDLYNDKRVYLIILNVTTVIENYIKWENK